MLCVFGFAASAFAMHADIPSETTAAIAQGDTQITLSGQIRVRYDWRHVGFYSSDSQPEINFWNERIRLGVLAKMSPNTSGFIELSSETDTTQADEDNLIGGGSGTAGAVAGAIGYSPSKSAGSGQLGNELKGNVSIRNMWILYKGTGLLGVESGVKVGHMPMSLGSGLFFDHTYYGDDGIIAYMFPVKELEIAGVVNVATDGNLVAGKSATNYVSLSDKATGYVLLANYKPSKSTAISGDVTYFDVQNIGDAITASTTSAPTASGTFPDLHLWNFALRGNTEVSGIRFKIDGELQAGSITAAGAAPKADFSGYAIQAGVGYTLDPVMLDLEYGYGSGNNGHSTTKYKTFFTAEGPESTFGDPYRYSHGVQGPYVYNYRTVNAAGLSYGGLQNTEYIRVGANTDLTKALNFDAAFFYLYAPEEITRNNVTGGNDSYDAYAFSMTNVTASGYHPSHDIGEEIDAKITYKIDKGLQTWVEGGYLWAGDFWKAYPTVAPGASPSNNYTARVGMQLDF